MTSLLASIASRDEIAAAVSGGADVIDLKDPGAGALGAWPLSQIRAAVSALAGSRPVSATIGDLPMDPALVARTARLTLAAGVDIIKIGMFPGPGRRATIAGLAPMAAEGARLVGVLFADRDPDFKIIEHLRAARFFGVMLDTADKTQGSLLDHADAETLARFMSAAAGLRTGLAGSLGIGDIAALAPHAPDFLGFRRALCENESRTGRIDPAKVAGVRAALDQALGRHNFAARQATATAGAQIPAA